MGMTFSSSSIFSSLYPRGGLGMRGSFLLSLCSGKRSRLQKGREGDREIFGYMRTMRFKIHDSVWRRALFRRILRPSNEIYRAGEHSARKFAEDD